MSRHFTLVEKFNKMLSRHATSLDIGTSEMSTTTEEDSQSVPRLHSAGPSINSLGSLLTDQEQDQDQGGLSSSDDGDGSQTGDETEPDELSPLEGESPMALDPTASSAPVSSPIGRSTSEQKPSGKRFRRAHLSSDSVPTAHSHDQSTMLAPHSHLNLSPEGRLLLQRKSFTPVAFSAMSDPERELTVSIILHCADISNPCKEWSLSKRWSDLVSMEFFAQGDREKEERLPQTPNTDRKTTDRAQFSLNFIDFVVAPLFVSLRQLLPSTSYCCDILRSNRKRWEKLLEDNIALSALTEEAKSEERARWMKRHTGFYDIIIAPGRTKRGSSISALKAAQAAAQQERESESPVETPTET